MAVVCVLGAGRMGTAFCTPLLDRGHQVRLVGTHLDVACIDALRATGVHPGLEYPLPTGATFHQIEELTTALDGAEMLVIGVSSAGIPWATGTLAPLLTPGLPIIFLTKGLEWDGAELQFEPDVFVAGMPQPVRTTLRPVAVTGPCIAGELIRQRETCVTFAGRDAGAVSLWAEAAATPYYHITQSLDFTGCEAAAALKDAFAIASGFAAGNLEQAGESGDGLEESGRSAKVNGPAKAGDLTEKVGLPKADSTPKTAGVAGHNYESAIFAESIAEMADLVELAGGRRSTVYGMVGVGDLMVTTHARNARLGRMLGRGLSLDQAISQMPGVTLEGVVTIRAMAEALASLDTTGRTRPEQFPLLRHLIDIVDGTPVAVPFERFFQASGSSEGEGPHRLVSPVPGPLGPTGAAARGGLVRVTAPFARAGSLANRRIRAALGPVAAVASRSHVPEPLKRAGATLSRRLPVGTFRLLGAALVVAVVAAAAGLSGVMSTLNSTLLSMGFDTDRAQLISSLSVGSVAAAAAALVTGAVIRSGVMGFLAVLVLFGNTFYVETKSAVNSTGVFGSFSLSGWLLTFGALVVAGVIAGLAGAAIAAGARPAIAEAVGIGRALVAGKRVDRPARLRAGGVAAVAVLLLFAVPVFGDLINFAVDARMTAGGPERLGLGGAGITTTMNPDETLGPAPTPAPTAPVYIRSSSQPTPQVSPTPVDRQPWLSWKPSGHGDNHEAFLPAPWKNMAASLLQVDIYTPPGYDPNGSLHYPTIYALPWALVFWTKAASITVAFDNLIDSGTIPPAILVAIDDGGGPYPDPECINSFDGKEQYDTFVAQSVVPYVDQHFLTIQKPAARATMGMSQGGFCATILALRHPDLFGSAISFSGYYHSGAAGGSSLLPFGGDKKLMTEYSPAIVASDLDSEARANLFFVIIAQPAQDLYGPEAREFDEILTREGYPHLRIDAEAPHGWVEVRDTFPTAIQAWAGRMVDTRALEIEAAS